MDHPISKFLIPLDFLHSENDKKIAVNVDKSKYSNSFFSISSDFIYSTKAHTWVFFSIWAISVLPEKLMPFMH